MRSSGPRWTRLKTSGSALMCKVLVLALDPCLLTTRVVRSMYEDLQLLLFVEVSCAEVYARLCSMERGLWSGG